MANLILNISISIVLLLIGPSWTYSQNSTIDGNIFKFEHIDSILRIDPDKAHQLAKNLEREADLTNDHILKAKALRSKGNALRKLNRKEEAAFSNLECANTLINNNIRDSALIAECYFGAANNYFFLGLFDLSKDLAMTSLKYLDTSDFRQTQISAYSLLGDVFLRQGNYEQSLVYYDSCYQIDLQFKDTTYISSDLLMLGRINSLLGRRDEALSFIQEAFDILNKEGHQFEHSLAYNALGLAYSNLNEFEKAEENILKALQISEEINDKELILNRMVNLCITHTKFERYDSGNQYCQRCLDLMKETAFEPNRFTLVHQNLGKIYHAKGQDNEAHESLQKALSMAKKGNQLPQMKEIYQTMAQQHLEINMPKKAFEYMDKYQTISDSIFTLNTHVHANALKFKYEAVKKEAEIKSLTLTNELKEQDLRSLKTKQQGIFMFTILLSILGLLSFFIYRQRQKNALALKEKEIDNQLSKISALQQDIARALDQKPTKESTLSFEVINQFINDDLTDREYEILELVLDGNSNQEIADKVFLSVNTIKFHLKKIYAKLDVANRVEVMQLLLKK